MATTPDPSGTRQSPPEGGGPESVVASSATNLGNGDSSYSTGADEDELPAALLPKILAPFVTRPGDIPRKVQIERKKRLFAMQSIEKLLHEQHGLGRIAPADIGPGSGGIILPEFSMDLAIFDNEDYESRTPEQWLGVPGGTPAFAVRTYVVHVAPLVDKEATAGAILAAKIQHKAVRFEPCKALESRDGRLYLIKWDDTQETEWVPRVHLYFRAEDPFIFATRHAQAYKLREITEDTLRYNLYVDCMPVEDIPLLTTEQINRMLGYALNSKKLRDKLMDTSALIHEVNTEYARSLCKIVFDGAFARDGPAGSNRLFLKSKEQQDMLVSIPHGLPEEEKKPPVLRGTVEVPLYNFQEQFGELCFHSCLTKLEVITINVKVKVECHKIVKMSLFNFACTKSLRLEEFEQMQMQASDQVANHLKESWVINLRNLVRNTFKDVGKGWFNLGEQNMETYAGSKLKKVLTMIRFIMGDTLRFLTEESLYKFARFVREQCAVDVEVLGTNDVITTPDPAEDTAPFEKGHYYKYHGGGREKKDKNAKKGPPLFQLELVIKDGKHLIFSTPPSAFEPSVIKVFDHAMTCLQTIPQLEPQIMEHLFWSRIDMVQGCHPLEEEVATIRQRVRAYVAKAVDAVEAYGALYKCHEALLALDTAKYIAEFEAAEPTLEQLKAEAHMHLADRAELDKSIPSAITVGPFHINCKKVRDQLLLKKEKMNSLVLDLWSRIPKKMAVDVCKKFDELEKVLNAKANCIEDVAKQREFIDSIPRQMVDLQESIDLALVYYDALAEAHCLLSDADFSQQTNMMGWPSKLERLIDRTQKVLAKDQAKFAEAQKEEQEAFAVHMESLEVTVGNFSQYKDLGQADFVAGEARKINEQLARADREAKLFNSREALFGVEPTDYSHVRRVTESFEPFSTLWLTASNWKEWHAAWMHNPFNTLPAEEIERLVTTSFKGMFKAAKTFATRGMEEQAAMCEVTKAQVGEFKPHCPLITALRNPGMRDRHWDQLSTELGMDLHPDPSFTLTKAIQIGLPGHLDVITKVSEVAAKEFAIEQTLDKMQGEWKSLELTVLPYRETGTYIMRLEESIAQMLDDHMVMTQSMNFSPYKKPFEERITQWESQLKLASEILEEWTLLQRQWMYLEPIFSSEDILHQLPLEGKRFATVDRTWRKTLHAAHQTPHILTTCSSHKLLESFVEGNRMLDSVQKGLADYLETKRMLFSRFFFLSNDELLQILSQTKNPRSVQPHLRKCFEAIAALDFADNLEISAMNSAEGEKVKLDKPMFPVGNVEDWLKEVENRMKASVRAAIEAAVQDYVLSPRVQWVQSWPAMVVLCGSSTFWTREVEAAIHAGSLPAYFEDKQVKQLMDLTDMVRGNLDRLVRLTLGALIVIDVHARDVTQKLIDDRVGATSDFEWVSQMRYYWEDENVYVRMVQATRMFGYEYLGNTSRLVITPLTDRCYMTLMSALHLNLGGAPAGPAGTGKTETTKDLAKALAKQCVVFNCSDGLDYLAMGKFFKGLASSGAWACFDEFNRIDLEVLSVVAQQILTIQLAIQQKLKRFIFEDSEINLDDSCSVYITMNPGYAGRSELPDNLKALFRPCAMMVPDYALIGEISMYSFGFKNAKNLARKMVSTFTLCSEQLSSQDHYDYGMRAVKSVITAAGNLKRDYPDENEDVLLLRGLSDVNVPKFLSHDLPLFMGIISDLFPGVKKPKADYERFLAALSHSCDLLNIVAEDNFVKKVIQLYETTLVRHGLMLVGPTGAGKTKCYKALQRTMTDLRELPTFKAVKVVCLNPKSITMGQLYGEFDENTHEWTDGVLACYMRECAEDTSDDKKWIMFDGPVDAIWIENMNTVLDDNKKLCLVSGEIIQLTPTMTMMFEVEDLAVASPATVSRCGMVYMEPSALSLDALVTSWLDRLAPVVSHHRDKLLALFKATVPGAVDLVRKHLKETVATAGHNLVLSLFHVFDSLLLPFDPDAEDGGTIMSAHKADEDSGGGEAGHHHRVKHSRATDEDRAKVDPFIEPWFVFSLVWSIGASCDKPSRAKFNASVRALLGLAGTAVDAIPPEDRSLYDCFYDTETRSWQDWMAMPGVAEFNVPAGTPFSKIIVPTMDTVRYSYVLDKLMRNHCNVLCVGDTGTGKTLMLQDKLSNGMPELYAPLFLTFSARTSANQTQDLLDGKLDKKRKGVFGPPSGKKFIIMVDDMNMPQREKYFAQPPIELLRQWMDHGGWYELKPPCAFREVIDIQFVGSMGPPGGGRNPVTARFLRHFNFIAFTDLADDSISRIFSAILGPPLESFPADVQKLKSPILAATITLYNTCRTELLPTPSKSHYTFNLRDLAKVIQGVLRADPHKCQKPEALLSLWMHECARVFQDRLVNAEDAGWFRRLLASRLKEDCGYDWADVVTADRIIYGDYLVPQADPRVYQQATDMDALVKVVEDYLEDYNSLTNAPMRLVLFLDAIEHVSRICRVIGLPLGNALLLGVGGSGRQSLTRLATYMEEYELMQIEVVKGYGNNEWKEDLKKVLMMAGVDGKLTTFLFTDTQVVQESFLEDINNILNSGEVPNLLSFDDMETISNAMRPILQAAGQPVTKASLYAQFVSRVRQHLHVVLAMSPIGDAFRNRLRMFPSLVNCCTIDWFSEWPKEALTSVARSFLVDVTMEDEQLVSNVVSSCMFIHQSVEAESRLFLAELGRFNYVTPTSYLELLQTFIKLVGEKREEIGMMRRRLETGLDKLLHTAREVEKMKVELVELQPMLEKTVKDVEEMMVTINRDKLEASETRATVKKQEADANLQAAGAKEIADSAQRDLDAALPALDAALSSLKNLTRNDIVEVKSMRNPPEGVKLVMEATCIMFQIPPKMVADPVKMGKKIADYWDASSKMLTDPTKFLESLLQYDKDNIGEPTIQKIEPYIEMESFTPEQVSRVSKACTSICMWVRAMYTYHNVAKSVAPKREQLAAAQATLDVTMASLAATQAALKDVEDKIAALEANYEAAIKKKEELSTQVNDCHVKLTRAEKLIGGLGGEKVRWSQIIEQLARQLANVVGDVVIAAGSIAYLGPFTPLYRQRLNEHWESELKRVGMAHTPGTNMRLVLQDPVLVRTWMIAGLPSDSVSLENGIIVSKARRWPLMIDPQGQANRWVKNLYKESGLDIIKQSEKDFLRTLENGVRFGRAVLMENVGESLDPALEPLLLKQTFKQGGSEVIKIGDNILPYHPDFKFFMTSKLRNPHYPPEVSVKVSLLNFFVTSEGLEDQLLGQVVSQERPDLAEMKSSLVVSNAKMKKELKETEDKILFLLSNSQGDILEDETLINTLAQSKVTSDEISLKVTESEKTEREIDTTRNVYHPVAVRASLLFFCISDLALVDPMYQYSLSWFINLFHRSIDEAAPSPDVAQRIVSLNETFTLNLYLNVCRSLFEKHKLMFSFLLTMKVLQHEHEIDGAELRYLLAGPTSTTMTLPKPEGHEWITDKMWLELLNLSNLPHFVGFAEHVAASLGHYKALFDSSTAHQEPLAGDWQTKLSSFAKLLVLRCLRTDKLILGVRDFVAEKLGPQFVEPPTFDLAACYRDASPTTPLIFVLSAGADPMADLLKLAEEMRFTKKFEKVSLGQGQGPKAERLLQVGMDRGMWVCLQNCHLSPSWMPALERIVENIDPEKVHKDFRLWLTSMPSPDFPGAILQNGVKMTLEPPKGLRSNLLRSYTRFTDKYLNDCDKPRAWQRLLYGVCLFHAVIQERRKFGPLGWNIRYDFTDGDLSVCQTQLQLFLNEYQEVPYRVIRFLCAEINYGGRVTDDKDRRLMNNLLRAFVNERVLEDSYAFTPSGDFVVPDATDLRGLLEAIRAVPLSPKPEIFGLNDNAEITCDQNESYELLATVLALQPRQSSGEGLSREAQVEKSATEILGQVPPLFDMESVQSAYPTTYKESMNTVLAQECIRYNGLLSVMKRSLQDALKALKGLVVMSHDLEMVCNSIYDNMVPDMWAGKAYPSLKPLSLWVVDLLERCTFISTWIKMGAPPVFWISGFFFPQAFLTGTLQNYARKYGFPIDTVSFSFQIVDDKDHSEVVIGPDDGCYIRGMYLEGARWDAGSHLLAESLPKELYNEMPIVWLKPQQFRVPPSAGIYECPVYKTLTRAGTLSTTGHSTNFIMYLEIPRTLPGTKFKFWCGMAAAATWPGLADVGMDDCQERVHLAWAGCSLYRCIFFNGMEVRFFMIGNRFGHVIFSNTQLPLPYTLRFVVLPSVRESFLRLSITSLPSRDNQRRPEIGRIRTMVARACRYLFRVFESFRMMKMNELHTVQRQKAGGQHFQMCGGNQKPADARKHRVAAATRRCGQRIQCQARNGRKGDLASQGSDVRRYYAIQPVHDLFVELVPRGSTEQMNITPLGVNVAHIPDIPKAYAKAYRSHEPRAVTHYTMSKRLSTQRSLAAALSNENTSAAPAAASPTGPEGSGATSQALVVAQPPAEPASPAASPEPKRSRSAEPSWTELDFVAEASQPGFLDTLNPERILVCVFYGTHASLLALCKQLFNQGRLFDPRWVRLASFDIIPSLHRPFLQQFALFSLLGRSIGELWPPKPLTTTLTESSLRSLLKEVLEEHLRDIDQRLKDNAIAIEVLQNTAGLTAQAVKDIAAKPAPAGLAGDAPPITTWADMLKQHTTSTTSAVAAQLQRQTLDLREEAELAQRSLNVIVKNFTMEEGETSEKLLRAFEREILGRMGLIGEIALAAHRLPRARGKAGPPPLLLTFKTPADKISFLRRRKRLEKTLFTLDDDLTLAQQQRRRELWPIYLQLRQTKAGQPVYWKGAAIYVGHKPWQATPPPRGPSDSRRPSLGEYSSSSAE
eukprot:jgi/Mesvir1/20936/Mv08007-RA.1